MVIFKRFFNILLLPLFFLGLLFPIMAFAQGESFDAWLRRLGDEAVQSGVSSRTVEKALGVAAFQERVIELDRRQPESTITFKTYANNVVRPERVAKGRRLMREHKDLLGPIAARYGVPDAVIVALWGVESAFGNNMGGFNVVSALATLAYEGRRAAFFRRELIHTLHLLDEEGMDPSDLLGSWAGAMGQSQFMPSTFRRYAVDYDGDGRRDIWTTQADVFASIAHYLKAEGWKSGQRWGREVKLTRPVPKSDTGLDVRRDLKTWESMGVRTKDGKNLPVAAINASLIQPDGPKGRSFLVYDNFRTLMRWNRSTYFATSVGLLSDRLALP